MTPEAQDILRAHGGVEMRPPPAVYLDQTSSLIADAVQRLGKDERGVITWVVTTKGLNLAVVDKINDHVTVTAWIGRHWGEPIEAGIAGCVQW